MAIDCRRCEETLVDWLYGELSEQDSAEIARHLEGCPACSRRAGEFRETMRALDLLKGAQAPLSGLVLNRMPLRRSMGYGYYQYSPYYDYRYHGKYSKKGVYGS